MVKQIDLYIETKEIYNKFAFFMIIIKSVYQAYQTGLVCS